MEMDFPKDPVAATDNRTNKRTRIHTTKRKTKMDEQSICRENNRSHMANMDNKEQPNI